MCWVSTGLRNPISLLGADSSLVPCCHFSWRGWFCFRLALRVTSSPACLSLKRRQSIPSGERRGGGSPARSRICRAVSAGPGGSCWTRPCNAPGNQRPCGDRGRAGSRRGAGPNTAQAWQVTGQPRYLSISVHHRMSSFSFMNTGKCWSLPCLMELERVVMVLTLLNCKRHRARHDGGAAMEPPPHPGHNGQAGRVPTDMVTPISGLSVPPSCSSSTLTGPPHCSPRDTGPPRTTETSAKDPTVGPHHHGTPPPALATSCVMALTFAILPCSRHSCSSSLSLTVDASGLGEKRGGHKVGMGCQCHVPMLTPL